MTAPGGPEPAPARPSIDERAAKRDAMESPGRDRYDALLRHLQAGREIPIQPRRRRVLDIDVHPSAGKVVLGFLILVAAWFIAIAVTDALRQGRIDTWTNGGVADPTVQSGLARTDCPAVQFSEDVYFPNWLSFEGRIFRWSDMILPIGPNSVGNAYPDTGYRNGDLQLYRVANTEEGRAGRQLLLRQGTSPVGAVYFVTDCA